MSRLSFKVGCTSEENPAVTPRTHTPQGQLGGLPVAILTESLGSDIDPKK
jgi:hypothetical protein